MNEKIHANNLNNLIFLYFERYEIASNKLYDKLRQTIVSKEKSFNGSFFSCFFEQGFFHFPFALDP